MKSDGDTLFQISGDMAARMAVKEWALTPLGLPSSWPQSLRAIVRVMLTSRYAMWMAWGPIGSTIGGGERAATHYGD
jgi:hypothetical protein